MPTYRLRIELPDRPGALAGVTRAIADSDANLVSVDVHEVDGETAVDEIVVDVALDWAPRSLAAALAASGMGSLLSSRRVSTVEDPLVSVLRSLAKMLANEPGAFEAETRRALLAVAHGSSARILDVAEAEREVEARATLERGTSLVTRADDHGWILTAVDDPFDPARVAVVSRSLNLRFSATEVARVEALLRLCRVVALSGGVATGS
jgi:hypothetical protein